MPAIVNATRITAANSGTIPATTGGNMLVVVFGGSNGAGSTGTCSTSGCTLGTTALGKIGEVDALAAQSASCCAAYMLAGIPDSVTTVTVTGTGLVSADSYLVVYEVSGMGPAPFVTTLATVNNAGGVTTWSTDIGTAPPTPAITQFLAAITAHGPNSGQPNTLTPAGSWTNQTQFSWGAPGGDTIAGAQITSGSACTLRYNGTSTDFDFYTALAVAISPGSGPSVRVPRLAPGWHPGRGLPGLPGGTPFYTGPPAEYEVPAGVTAISLTDVAAVVDDDSSVPIEATVALADDAGAADAQLPAASAELADIAAATDTLASPAVAVPLADQGAVADSLAETVAAVLADTAAVIDAEIPAAAVSLSDTAAETDTTLIGVFEADTAGAADQLTVAAALSTADIAAAADAIQVQHFQADVAAAADQLAATVTTSLPDVAGAADTILVQSGSLIQLTDVGAATDGVSEAATIVVADTGAAADHSLAAVSAGLADAAGAADSPQISAVVQLADTAAAVQAIQLTVSVVLTDAAGAADQLSSPAIAVVFADAGAVTDGVSTAVSAHLADVAAAADVLVHFTPSQLPMPDRAFPAPARWAVSPAVRWQAEPDGNRWLVLPAQQWQAGPTRSRWRILMAAFDPIAAISNVNVNVTWTSDLAGTVIDPTDPDALLTVQMAFPATSGNPARPAEPSSWLAASWLQGSPAKGYVAQCLVGPGGVVQLTAGLTYDVWSKITGSPESPAIFAGTLEVY